MRHRRLLPFIFFFSLLSVCQLSHAAAFQLYELGTPVVGTADVGQTVVKDASISYFNPAGMSALDHTQVMVGSEVVIPNINFSTSSANTISGNNGSNAGVLTPLVGGYFVYSYSPQLKLGLSLTAPYGGELNYNNHWVGRYVVQQMQLYTLNLNPALAYKVNQWLSLGAGISIEYANLNQAVALPVTALVDGQVTLKVSNYSPGFNLGILFTPTNCTHIGLAYRSQIVHHLSGNIDFLNLSTTPTAHTKMVMPSNVIASISQKINNKFNLLGELGWSNWSTMVNTIVHVDGFTGVTPQNWHDTYRVGVGGQYQFSDPLLVQAGASYDSSPTSSSKRLPDLPMDRQIRLGLGLEYAMMKSATLGLSYEYINYGNASINNTSSNGVLAGSYSRNYANVLQLSLNAAC